VAPSIPIPWQPIPWRPGRRAILLLAALACLLGLLAQRIVSSETAARQLEVAHRHAALADRLGARLEDRMMAREGALLEELTAQGADREAIVARIRALPPSASWAQPILLLADDGSILGGTGKMGGAAGRAPLAGRRTNRGDRFRWLLRDIQRRRRTHRDAHPPAPARAFVPELDVRRGASALLAIDGQPLWIVHRLRPAGTTSLLAEVVAAAQLGGAIEAALLAPDGAVWLAPRSERPTDFSASSRELTTLPRWRVATFPSRGDFATVARHDLRGYTAKVALGWALAVGLLGWTIGRGSGRGVPLHPRNLGSMSPPPSSPTPMQTQSVQATEEEQVFRLGETLVDLKRYIVVRGDREQPLTDREVSLLTLLIAAPGEVIRRDRLLDEIWGYEASATTRTVDTFVYRLRQKIEAKPSRPRYLITVRGAGYKYVP